MSGTDPGDRWGAHLGLEMLEVGPERVLARIEIDERHHDQHEEWLISM